MDSGPISAARPLSDEPINWHEVQQYYGTTYAVGNLGVYDAAYGPITINPGTFTVLATSPTTIVSQKLNIEQADHETEGRILIH
jgi:hypothetical protein